MFQSENGTAPSLRTPRFEFSVAENETPPPSGFDLGYMDVRGNRGEAGSRDRTPDQAMMIYLSLPLLMDGLRRFLPGQDRSFTTSAGDLPSAVHTGPSASREAGSRCCPRMTRGERIWRSP